MDNTNALPTTLGAVEDWLRSLTTPQALETGGYAYLFGMATVKLADAHREIARLQAEKAARTDAIVRDIMDLELAALGDHCLAAQLRPIVEAR